MDAGTNSVAQVAQNRWRMTLKRGKWERLLEAARKRFTLLS
jgi:hypothetical protein